MVFWKRKRGYLDGELRDLEWESRVQSSGELVALRPKCDCRSINVPACVCVCVEGEAKELGHSPHIYIKLCGAQLFFLCSVIYCLFFLPFLVAVILFACTSNKRMASYLLIILLFLNLNSCIIEVFPSILSYYKMTLN